jgi:phospholipase/carboxylesterase
MISPEAKHLMKQTDAIEQTLTAEISLRYDLLAPEITPAPLLIALHGYGASKRQMMREAQMIAPETFAIVALQGPHQHLKEAREPGGPLRFGFGWLTNFHPEESIAVHHQALLEIVRSLTTSGTADRQKVFLLGFSQSCSLNYRFAFTYSNLLRGVIGICGGAPGDWVTSDLYAQTEAAVFHLSGERDEFYPPSRTADYGAVLRTRATDVELRSYDAGHEIVPAMRDDISEWLKQRSTPSPSGKGSG